MYKHEQEIKEKHAEINILLLSQAPKVLATVKE